MMLCGGLSDAKDANKDVQQICDKVKRQVEHKTGKNYHVFTAKKYKAQTVAGFNYFVKIHVGGVEYIHVRVLEKLACNGGGVELTAVQCHKTHDDPIEHF